MACATVPWRQRRLQHARERERYSSEPSPYRSEATELASTRPFPLKRSPKKNADALGSPLEGPWLSLTAAELADHELPR